ncbi:oxaloacetate-decarboxylating malate dehydrogenase [Sneathiella chungangensis]|uniref:Malolactic enzyme n=1 Tax=Sneathiella chungangensis TaxID=1418234 RepID=A0A845M7N0_9PROT|nr:NAD-dependent malic enzyme [Sneathiella chungangensis]MZR20729.1 oxaloacetate-decarboxylating malate dehydrogenase [Sneathiella chungangensis]
MAEFSGNIPVGLALLSEPVLNKGTAFTLDERQKYGLLGLLPPHIETLEEQTDRAYRALQAKDTDLERHIYLRALQDTNEVLFYNLVIRHVAEMMPLIYTPVVGEACEQFSEIYRRPRGLFISYPHRHEIDRILDNALNETVEAIVVTDGERILGLGDQGTGGMGIPIGKLALYTAAGGVDPSVTLPIILDVGTNNEERLKDPLYIGWRHERITGDDYFDFVDQFIQAVKRKWPGVLLQFEDFAQPHAEPLLAKYRDELCTYNDDIQGTAAVAAGTLLAACKMLDKPLSEHHIAFLGAGSAGAGIAEQLIRVMIDEGLSDAEARKRVYMVDRYGLLHSDMEGLMAFQEQLTQDHASVASWSSAADGSISLLDVVKNGMPSILIGVSGQHGLFTEEIIREMAKNTERPIIFPLSNPTSRAEAVPEDILEWTDGQALIGTGSPFEPVTFKGKTHHISQSNNTYIFPGVGLGVLAGGATRVTDNMFMASSRALAELSPALQDPHAALLPPISDIREVSKAVALAVAKQAVQDKVAPDLSGAELVRRIEERFWTPAYQELT